MMDYDKKRVLDLFPDFTCGDGNLLKIRIDMYLLAQ